MARALSRSSRTGMARSQRGVSALPRRSCSHTAPAAQHVLGRDMAAGDVRQRLRRRRTVSSERGDVEAMFKRSINYLHTSYHLPSTHHTLPLSTRLLSTPCSVSASLTHMPASQHPHLTFYGAIALRSGRKGLLRHVASSADATDSRTRRHVARSSSVTLARPSTIGASAD